MRIPGKLEWVCFLLLTLTIFISSHAKEATFQLRTQQDSKMGLSPPIMVAGALCFVVASISSAGGIGGGGLFLPILMTVAGLDLKTASSLTAFMVTGVSVANVACNMIIKNGGKTLIDYDIALLSEPFILLGVSIGVICNVVFPEWLITVTFAVFLAWSTFKTFKSGMSFWKSESERMKRNGFQTKRDDDERSREAVQNLEETLLHKEGGFKVDVPWMKFGLLIIIWFCFFLLYLFRDGSGIISIKPCGVAYWIISATQIPLAIIFTSCILYCNKTGHAHGHEQEPESGPKNQGPDKLALPVMALLVGGLSGLFGIGGGMLISPLLLQIGVAPEITAATCSFMVLFSSTMSAFQFLLLGMDQVYSAIIFGLICFAASLIGQKIVKRAIVQHGRASLIVFSVATVMAASTVLITYRLWSN